MLYCTNCQSRNKWPISWGRSFGPCEMCGVPAFCYDVPSSQLPNREPMKTTGERVKKSSLRKGDVFQLIPSSINEGHMPIYRVMNILPKDKENPSPRLKLIELTPRNEHYGAYEDGYVYFPIVSASMDITKLDYKPEVIPGNCLSPGDRVAPLAYPNDIMIVKSVGTRKATLTIEKYVEGYLGKRGEVELVLSRHFYLYHRKKRTLTEKKVEAYGAMEYATVPYEPGTDAYVYSDDGLMIRHEGRNVCLSLRDHLFHIHKFNLMSEEEFKAKHETLRLAHWDVTEEGEYIRVACHGHTGEQFNKGDIHSFMSVVQRILKEKDRMGLSVKGVYDFLVNNQKQLGL